MATGKRHPAELRTEAMRLRREERMPLKAIARRLALPVATVGTWLRGHPLTEEERRKQYPVLNRYRTPKKNLGDASALSVMASSTVLSQRQKGAAAEAAVLLRLTLLGHSVYASPFDGDRVDWLVMINGRPVRVAVRWVRTQRYGLPSVSLKCSNGRVSRRYSADAFDVIAGYSLHLDTVFVWSAAECATRKSAITITPDAAERWDKLLRP